MSETPINDPYPNRIIDSEKAYSMAQVGHPQRRQAASARQQAKEPYRGSSHIDNARRYDRAAERLENWAGILYDYPVSKQYKLTRLHPEREPEEGTFDYSPMDMVNLENKLEYRKNYIHSGIGKDPNKFDAERVTSSHRSTRWNLLKTLREFQGPIERRLESMVKSDSTTLGDLVQTYKDVWQEIFDARQAHIRRIEEMLDDVRSGRASEEPEAA